MFLFFCHQPFCFLPIYIMSAYPESIDKDNLQDELFRKEFAQLKLNHQYIQELLRDYNKGVIDDQIVKENYLILQNYQLFARNFFGPETNSTRGLLDHATGVGKTISTLTLGLAYVKYYQQQHNMTEDGGISDTPLVIILGFSKNIFQRELLRRPEFGFITKEEILEHRRLSYLAETGSQADKDALAEFETRIKKRLSKKGRGGFFKFYGYKEFFNRLFIFSEEALKNIKKTRDLSLVTDEDGEHHVEAELPVLDEDIILDGLKRGTITLNMDLVDLLANSFIIADEIHRVYNSSEINNYGIAIRTILNIYDVPELFNKIYSLEGKTASGKDRMTMLRNAQLRIIYASATPLNQSPTECVDLLNILVPTSDIAKIYPPSIKNGLLPKLRKEDFFSDTRNLKNDALELIRKLIIGRVSFLRDNNPKYYPERIFRGEEIRIPNDQMKYRARGYRGNTLPFLKFIRCPMSPLHYKTYKKFYTGTLPPDGQSLVDMIYPNPDLVDETKGLGLFKSKDVKYSLTNASRSWKDKHHIDIVKQDNPPLTLITGEFLNLEELATWSSKYAQMMQDLLHNLKNNGGKIFISHEYVKMSGVLQIQEILRRNGLIDEYAGPTDETLCSKCGLTRHQHSKKSKIKEHDYIPARFIIVHGDIEKAVIEKSLSKFNSSDNVWGYNYRVLVGSKKVNEGIDLTAIQEEWIMTAPPNIPTLIQKFGRGIRKGSHLQLPPENRKTHISIYVSSLPGTKKELSYEERKYFEKLQDYIVMTQIDEVFASIAIDAPINRSTVIASRSEKGKNELGVLYYEIDDVFGKKWREISQDSRDVSMSDVSLDTFNMYYSDEEVNTIIYIIKRLFVEQSPIWNYKELWNTVKNPPFEVNVNPKLFVEGNFIIALMALVTENDISDATSDNKVDTYQILTTLGLGLGNDNTTTAIRKGVSRFFDGLDRRIVARGRDCRIIHMQGYYILFPITETISGEDLEEETFSGKTSPAYLGVNAALISGVPEIDIDTWYRYTETSDNTVLRVTKQLQTSNISYNQMKYKFYNQFKDTPVENLSTTTEVYDMDFHARLVEESIRYAFNVLTNPNMVFSEIHDFYFKMLYFYDRLELILFADHIEDTPLISKYRPYITKAKIDYYEEPGSKHRIIKEDHKYNPFLMSSIIKNTGEQSTFNINRLNDFLGRKINKAVRPRLEDMILAIPAKARTPKQIRKVFSNILPIGHFLITGLDTIGNVLIPKIYNPQEDIFVRSNEFVQYYVPKHEVENDIIVGYYEKTPGGIDIKFKLRPPVHKITKHEDTRMMERGSACNTRKKEELYEIAKQLGLVKNNIINDGSSIKDICQEIKLELMQREMAERRKIKHMTVEQRNRHKRVRWFYLHFETQLLDY